MPLRSRKHRFRCGAGKTEGRQGESDAGCRFNLSGWGKLQPLGLGKTTRSTTVFSGHGDSLVSSEQLAPTGCYSNINDGANTYRFTAPFCVVRRATFRRRNSERCSHHAVEPDRRAAYWHQETTVQPRILAARAPCISHGKHVMSEAIDTAHDRLIFWKQGWCCHKRRPSLRPCGSPQAARSSLCKIAGMGMRRSSKAAPFFGATGLAMT
jgi:hypothetical protein